MREGIKIAFVYIGLVIGAAFASGREIMEYFNLKSRNNLNTVVLATLLFIFVAYIILNKAAKYETSDFGEFTDRLAGGLSPFIKGFMFLFMFSGFFVMMSGCGELFSQTFLLPRQIGIWTLAVICFVVFVFDTKAVVALNVILVPFMIFGIAYLCITSVLYSNLPTFAGVKEILSNPFSSAVCYVSYNTITAGAVLVPLTKKISPSSIKTGAFIGGGTLGFMVFLVYITLDVFFVSLNNSEIPLFDLAAQQGEIYKNIYFTVLLMAICTTAVSNGFGLLSSLHLKTRCDRAIAAAILCLLAVPFASFGFSSLVAKLYSVFGYIGLLWLAMLIGA